MFLGIDDATGHVYEGLSVPSYPVWPSPVLSQAKLIENPIDHAILPTSVLGAPDVWIFREDMFDPVTRIRRGRLYEPRPGQHKCQWPVKALPYDHEAVREIAASRNLLRTLYTYIGCQSFANRSDRGLGTTLAIGQGASISLWRVVQTEVMVGEDVLVTLKAKTAFGVIPELDLTAIGEESQASVVRALERVIDAAFRETPISMIDQCRNAVTVVIARWLFENGASPDVLGKDLDQVRREIGTAPFNKTAVRDIAEAIRLLHPRGKANVQESKGYRIPVEEDAEFALHGLSFILRELHWAK